VKPDKPKPRKQPKKSPKGKPKKAKDTRIKPGQRLPGAGRPLGSKNLKGSLEAIASLYSGEVQFPGGVKRRLTGMEKLADRVFRKALFKGDLRAADMIFDRTVGRVAQTIKTVGNETRRIVVFDRGSLNPDPLPNEEGSDGKPQDEKDDQD